MWEGLAHWGQYYPLADGPGWLKEAGSTSHGQQASKQHVSGVSPCVPVLNFCSDLPQGWAVT